MKPEEEEQAGTKLSQQITLPKVQEVTQPEPLEDPLDEDPPEEELLLPPEEDPLEEETQVRSSDIQSKPALVFKQQEG